MQAKKKKTNSHEESESDASESVADVEFSEEKKRIIAPPRSSLPRAPADRLPAGAANVDGAAHGLALAGRDRERQERGRDDENRGRGRAGERRLQCLLEERRERREVKGELRERRELGGEVGDDALEVREVEGRGRGHGWSRVQKKKEARGEGEG